MESFATRIRKRGVLIIPKAVRDRLGLTEGTVVELEPQGEAILVRKKDLWAKVWGASRGTTTPEQAEAELDEAEQAWHERHG